MRTFIYTETDSFKRGYDRCITVYRVKHNVPKEIGESHHNTGSWKGGIGQAHTIVARHLKTRNFDGYRVGVKDVQIIKVL